MSCLSVFGQAYNFEYYSVNEGLSQSQVTCMYEDSRGFLWCGTSGGGLCRFDGKHFKVYDERNGLDGQIVNTISEDSSGNLWIGSTWGGLVKFDGLNFTDFTMQNGLSGNDVTATLIDKSGKIWIGTSGGLSIVDDNVIKNLNQIPSLKNYKIYQIIQDQYGTIWIATSNGLVLFQKSKGFFVPQFKDGSYPAVKLLYNNPFGNVMMVTKSNNVYAAVKIQGEMIVKRKLFFNDSISNYHISSMIYDKQSQSYLFGTYRKGILEVNKNKFSHIGKKQGLKSTIIKCMLSGKNNELWIGSSGLGLISLRNRSFLKYELPNGDILGTVFSICQDKNGVIWAGTLGNGVFEIANQQIKKSPISNKIKRCAAMAYDSSKDIMWFATNTGLFAYQKGKLKNYTVKDGLPSDNLMSLCLLPDSNLAIGTDKGLAIYDGKHFNCYDKEDGLANPYIHSLIEDDNKNLWIGTGGFAYRFSKLGFDYFGGEQGFCNAYIGSMAKDKFGHIWFATDRCVNMYDGVDIKTINIQNGLNSNTIYLLCADKDGNIWVGTNSGLNKIVLTGYGGVAKIMDFDKNRGYSGIECNTNASFCDKQGNLWFGTVNGLFEYRSYYPTISKSKPYVYITGIKLSFKKKDLQYAQGQNNWFHLPQNHKFDYSKNNINISFLAIYKEAPDNISYSFKLEGFDQQWSPKTSNTYVNYSNLPPGKYTFKVKAVNQNGIWSDTDKFSFTVKTPFWQQWWFYLLAICLFVYIIYRIIMYREQKRIATQQELEKLVTERTKEIRQQKEEKELLLKEVHHRVKNNMQVINSLINIQSSFVEDKKAQSLFEDCKNRIKSMALIHEKLYESKDLMNVSIEEYVSNLIDYLISAYEINNHIGLKEDIQVNYFSLDTLIPLGLIINEIVSNSLKYAFENKENNDVNVISLSLKQIEEIDFELIIGDNGIGFNHNLFNKSEQTLGLELIKILTDQIDGEVELLDKKGTWYKIRFKNKEKS